MCVTLYFSVALSNNLTNLFKKLNKVLAEDVIYILLPNGAVKADTIGVMISDNRSSVRSGNLYCVLMTLPDFLCSGVI